MGSSIGGRRPGVNPEGLMFKLRVKDVKYSSKAFSIRVGPEVGIDLGLKTLRRLAWQDPRKPSALLSLDFFYAPFVNIKIYKKADKISTEKHKKINPVAVSTKKKET